MDPRKKRAKQRCKNRSIAQYEKYESKFHYEINLYRSNWGKFIQKCDYSKKPLCQCLDDFNCLVEEFKQSMIRLKTQTKSSFLNLFVRQIPNFFKAKIHGGYIMSLLSNIENNDDTINVIFDNRNEYKKFIIMMMIVFKYTFFGFYRDYNAYHCHSFVVNNGEDIGYSCPCMIHYLCEYDDPLHTKHFKLKIDDDEIKFVLDETIPHVSTYNFDTNDFNFVESSITWERQNGKSTFGSIHPTTKVEMIKNNLLNKNLHIDTSKLKPHYRKTNDIVSNIILYYKNIVAGYEINEPFPMQINLLFHLDPEKFNSLFTGCLIVDVITIIYDFLKITNLMRCTWCCEHVMNEEFIVHLNCQCSENDVCHIKCLPHITETYTEGSEEIACCSCHEAFN